MITTSWGNWGVTGCPDIESWIANGIHGDDEYDVPAMVEEITEAVNSALPDGVVLMGVEFYGPWPADPEVGLGAIIGGVDFWAIAWRHQR